MNVRRDRNSQYRVLITVTGISHYNGDFLLVLALLPRSCITLTMSICTFIVSGMGTIIFFTSPVIIISPCLPRPAPLGHFK